MKGTNSALENALEDLKDEIVNAAQNRGSAAFFDVQPNEPAFAIFSPDELQKGMFDMIMHYRETGEVDPKYLGSKSALVDYPSNTKDIIQWFNEYASNSTKKLTVMDGITLVPKDIEKMARDFQKPIGRLETLFGIKANKISIFTKAESCPEAPLHELLHLRDFAVSPLPFHDDTAEVVSYETLTNVRTGLLIPTLPHPPFHLYLRGGDYAMGAMREALGPYKPQTNMPEALKALQCMFGGKNPELEEIVLDTIWVPHIGRRRFWRYQKADKESNARAAFNEALAYVIEAESKSPPITDEIRPQVLAALQ